MFVCRKCPKRIEYFFIWLLVVRPRAQSRRIIVRVQKAERYNKDGGFVIKSLPPFDAVTDVDQKYFSVAFMGAPTCKP